MARSVFFSFDYEHDVRRVEQVRNCGALDPQGEKIRFIDAANRESVKQGDTAIAKWIDNQMFGTSVTVVLFGSYTHQSKWVEYEIKRSVEKGNGLLGIAIHGIKDPLWVKNGYVGSSIAGPNPLNNVRVLDKDHPYGVLNRVYASDQFTVTRKVMDWEWNRASLDQQRYWRGIGQMEKPISAFYDTYDWVKDDGRSHIATWIEAAARRAGR